MTRSHETVVKIGRIIIKEVLAGRGASRQKVSFDDQVIEERIEKLVDEWITASLGAK